MKKSLIALAAVAVSGAAMAQSSVTLFGIVDTGFGYVDNAVGSDNKYGLTNSGNATSRIGFRGVEDLGGGLKAGFWLEGEIFADDGGSGLNFKRRSTVSLQGGFGEVRLGRDQVAGYNKTSSYDLFGQTGIGQFYGWTNWTGSSTADAAGVRNDNLISYYSPDFSGFKAGFSYGFDEKTGSDKSGRYVGGVVSYDNGPLSVALSYDQRKLAYAAGVTGDKDTLTVGASYDFGAAKLSGIAQQAKYEYSVGGGDDKYNSYAVGVSAPVGAAGVVKAQYALYDQKAIDSKAHQISLGYVHSLSKRTAVYGTVSYLKNKDNSNMGLSAKSLNTSGPGVGENQTGLQVGIRHAF